MTAREPRGLYAHYDPLADPPSVNASQAPAPRLVLRIYQDEIGGRLVAEGPVPADSRYCFVQVSQPGAAYAAEVGHYGPDERWQRLAASQPVATPVDAVSSQTTVRFASLPFMSERPDEMRPAEELLQLVAPAQLISPIEPEPVSTPAHPVETAHPPAAITTPSLPEASILPAPVEPMKEDSSPVGGAVPSRDGFWFELHADLVVHGTAAPGASIRIAGQPVPVRGDGSFSVRFSLPDGEHTLPVQVEGAQGETRELTMVVRRGTRMSVRG